ncbi:unnamed protein product [Ceratitis capitata]|uniref:(Mediterranean fruit fly) hypothetical protein n=1 Tax=Ceratitis capitata TaxID=7213 RepID=A0A811UB43_CERCA|nr:unnamed protein product [Ceratitis capitata]
MQIYVYVYVFAYVYVHVYVYVYILTMRFFHFIQSILKGLSSSRRHLQGGASISGSLHGINSVYHHRHICIAGVDGLSAGILINDDDGLDEDDDVDLDQIHHEIFINDVRFDDDENHLEQMHHLENV